MTADFHEFGVVSDSIAFEDLGYGCLVPVLFSN